MQLGHVAEMWGLMRTNDVPWSMIKIRSPILSACSLGVTHPQPCVCLQNRISFTGILNHIYSFNLTRANQNQFNSMLSPQMELRKECHREDRGGKTCFPQRDRPSHKRGESSQQQALMVSFEPTEPQPNSYAHTSPCLCRMSFLIIKQNWDCFLQ